MNLLWVDQPANHERQKVLGKDVTMKRLSNRYSVVAAAVILISTFGFFGCQVASQSPAPSEILKDPLGIDRAIEDYYFPDKKQPRATLGFDAQISKMNFE